MTLSKLIKPANVVFANTDNVSTTLELLVSKANELGLINNYDKFLKAIVERENIVSTGIGLGIAIPHSKLDEIKDFFIIVGILKNKVEWNSIDSKPVKTVFLIGGPTNAQKKYLGILSKIMLLIRNSNIRKKLFDIKNSNDITDIFKDF